MSSSESEESSLHSSSSSSSSSLSSSSISTRGIGDSNDDDADELQEKGKDDSETTVRRKRFNRREGQVRGFKRQRFTQSEHSGNQRQERCYSDSENSYEPGKEEEFIREGAPTIDFDEHVDYEWGQ